MAMDSTKTKENGRLGLTPTQVIASALAAITAAFLGSTLGVAGTVIGAGIASLVSTVGSAIYQHSLDRTGTTLRSRVTALRGSVPSSPASADSAGTLAGFTGVLEPGIDGADEPTRQPRPAAPPVRRRRPRWAVLAGLTVAAFVLGLGVVTAVELLHGGPISGGNAGTSVGSLFGESTQHATQSTTTVTSTTTTTPTTTTTTPTTTTSPTTTVTPGASTATSSPSTGTPSSTTAVPTTTAAPTTTP